MSRKEYIRPHIATYVFCNVTRKRKRNKIRKTRLQNWNESYFMVTSSTLRWTDCNTHTHTHHSHKHTPLTHTHTHIHSNSLTHTHSHTITHPRATLIHTHTHTHNHTHSYTHTHTHSHTHTHLKTQTHTHTHSHTHTNSLTHTHLQTQTHPEYVIIIAFPRRQLLCERTSLLRYKTHCLSCYSINSSRNISVHIVTRLRAALLSNGDWIARSDGKFFTSPNGLHPVWNPPHSASLQWVL